jgi:hypothetical protein
MSKIENDDNNYNCAASCVANHKGLTRFQPMKVGEMCTMYSSSFWLASPHGREQTILDVIQRSYIRDDVKTVPPMNVATKGRGNESSSNRSISHQITTFSIPSCRDCQPYIGRIWEPESFNRPACRYNSTHLDPPRLRSVE